MTDLRTACLLERAGSAVEYQNDSRAKPELGPRTDADAAGASMSKWIFRFFSAIVVVPFLAPIEK